MNDNKKASSGKLIIFMHIPKTGGTTLRKIINNQYKSHEVYNTHGNTIGNSELTKRIKCIQGHDIFGFHHASLHQRYTYLTMLRDPVDRIISEYYYLLQEPRHDRYINEQLATHKMTLEDYVTNKDKRFLLRTMNTQTRFASGETLPQLADLQKAKANLSKHFSVVGITEMFEQSVSLMNRVFSWEIKKYSRRNVTKKRPTINDVPRKCIAKIEQMNDLDMELYHWARKELKRRLKSN